jgi:hypothetical protein
MGCGCAIDALDDKLELSGKPLITIVIVVFSVFGAVTTPRKFVINRKRPVKQLSQRKANIWVRDSAGPNRPSSKLLLA